MLEKTKIQAPFIRPYPLQNAYKGYPAQSGIYELWTYEHPIIKERLIKALTSKSLFAICL